jgi:hypothetical protein
MAPLLARCLARCSLRVARGVPQGQREDIDDEDDGGEEKTA